MFDSREIGLQLLQSILDSALKMGTTFAILKTFGNVPLKNQLLISSDNGPDKVSLASLRIFVGMLLGPKDLLTCSSCIDLQTSSGVVGEMKKVSVMGSLRKLFFSWEDFFLNIFANAGKKVIEILSNVFGV